MNKNSSQIIDDNNVLTTFSGVGRWIRYVDSYGDPASFVVSGGGGGNANGAAGLGGIGGNGGDGLVIITYF